MCEIVKELRVLKMLMRQITTTRQRELVKFFDYYTVKAKNEEGEQSSEHELELLQTAANASLIQVNEENVFVKKILEDFDPANNDYDKEIAARLGAVDAIDEDNKDMLDAID